MVGSRLDELRQQVAVVQQRVASPGSRPGSRGADGFHFHGRPEVLRRDEAGHISETPAHRKNHRVGGAKAETRSVERAAELSARASYATVLSSARREMVCRYVRETERSTAPWLAGDCGRGTHSHSRSDGHRENSCRVSLGAE